MSLWRRNPPPGEAPGESGVRTEPPSASDEASREPDGVHGVAGERGIPPRNPFQSMQSRVTGVLTVTLMVVLAAGLLTWYYSGAITRHAREHRSAQAEQQRKAQGDSTLPPLGPFRMPPAPAVSPHESAVEQVLGPPPPPPIDLPQMPIVTANPYATPVAMASAPPPKTPAQLALDRRLAGPVLTKAPADTATPLANAYGEGGGPPGSMTLGNSGGSRGSESDNDPRGMTLASQLRPTETPAVRARVLPTQRFLLPKGAFIDCTLETAISSSLPGMTTCVTATDTFGADGAVVMLERGTKLVGETRGTVQQGSPRLFVLWTEARTPTGVVVPLASPGTDELGRSGLSGSIDRHWWDRFGAAILITVIDGAVQASTRARGSGSTVEINPSGASDVMTEVLRGTLSIPPTIDKPQGDRIQILVARDVDFRSVYALRPDSIGGE
jgi:type IV secretion system protein VirB10